METLEYAQVEAEVVNFISQNNLMVLATGSENRVSARTVSIINRGLHIYFQTDMEFLKYRQIKDNPNVALCLGNVQIEGAAKLIGHPLANPWFIENYQKYHPTSFAKYSHLQDNVVIEVTPHLVTLWKYTAGDQQPFRDFLDVKEQQAYREYYQK